MGGETFFDVAVDTAALSPQLLRMLDGLRPTEEGSFEMSMAEFTQRLAGRSVKCIRRLVNRNRWAFNHDPKLGMVVLRPPEALRSTAGSRRPAKVKRSATRPALPSRILQRVRALHIELGQLLLAFPGDAPPDSSAEAESSPSVAASEEFRSAPMPHSVHGAGRRPHEAALNRAAPFRPAGRCGPLGGRLLPPQTPPTMKTPASPPRMRRCNYSRWGGAAQAGWCDEPELEPETTSESEPEEANTRART